MEGAPSTMTPLTHGPVDGAAPTGQSGDRCRDRPDRFRGWRAARIASPVRRSAAEHRVRQSDVPSPALETMVGYVDTDVQHVRAQQQPEWNDPAQVQRIRKVLTSWPPLVSAEDVDTLRSLLARVAAGDAYVVQAGDCAEDPADRTAGQIQRKTAIIDLCPQTLALVGHKEVLRRRRTP